MVWCAPGVAWSQPRRGEPRFVIKPGLESTFDEHLQLTPGQWLKEHPYAVAGIDIEQTRVVVHLTGSGLPRTSIRLEHSTASCAPGDRVGQFIICHEPDDKMAPGVTAALVPGIRQLTGRVWSDMRPPADVSPGGGTGSAAEMPVNRPAAFWYRVSQLLVLAFFLFFLPLMLLSAWRMGSRTDRGVVALLFLAALLVRVQHATWGCGDYFLNVSEVFTRSLPYAEEYGNVPNALLAFLLLLLPATVATIAAVNLVLSGLAVVIFYLFLREAGKDWAGSFFAAVALAFTPLLVRYGGEATRQMPVLFFAIAAFWALARFQRTSYWVDGTAALLATALCAGCRPEAGMVVGFFVLYAVFSRVSTPRARTLALAAGALAAFFGIVYWMGYLGDTGRVSSDADMLFRPQGKGLFSPETCLWLNLDATSVVAMVMAGVGVVAAVIRVRTVALWAAVCLVVHTLFAAPWGVAAHNINMVVARFQTLGLLFFAVLAGQGMESAVNLCRRFAPVTAVPVAALLLAGLTWGSALPPHSEVLGKTTVDHEFRFIRETLPELPRGAVIYYVPINLDFALSPPEYLSVILDRADIAWRRFPDDWTPAPLPTFLLVNSACVYAGPRGDVLAWKHFEANRDLSGDCSFATPAIGKPVAVARVPYRPFMEIDQMFGEIEIGLYELDGRRADEIARRMARSEQLSKPRREQ